MKQIPEPLRLGKGLPIIAGIKLKPVPQSSKIRLVDKIERDKEERLEEIRAQTVKKYAQSKQ